MSQENKVNVVVNVNEEKVLADLIKIGILNKEELDKVVGAARPISTVVAPN